MLPRPAALDPPGLPLPLLGRLVPAGFPSPADDYLDGEMTIKRLRRLKDGTFMLVAEHPGYPSVTVGEEHPAEVWGVVVGCVRKMG